MSITYILTCVNSQITCMKRFILLSFIGKIDKGGYMNKDFSEKYKNLGLNIAFYRKKKGYTQMQLSELLDIDRSHMSAIELANVGVSLDVIFKICNVLNISEKELFDFRD